MLSVALATAIVAAVLLPVASAQASFGIVEFSATATNSDGSVDFQAGSHPHELTLSFSMNRDGGGVPEGTLRSVAVDLPPGLIATRGATPRCGRADFDTGLLPACPGDTQVGVADVEFEPGVFAHTGVYNLTPSPGSPATLGLSVDNNNSLVDASLRSGAEYGVTVSDLTVPTKVHIRAVTEHIWGVPMDEAHDPERLCPNPDDIELPGTEGCSSDADPAPFLTLPTSCSGPLKTTLRVESLEDLDSFQEATVESLDSNEVPTGLDGCNALEFEPTVTAQPTTNLADSPSGLDFDIHQPQDDDPEDLATAQLRDVQASLPPGLTLNAAAGDGLASCSEQQIGYQPGEGKVRFSTAPQNCPDAAKIGTAKIATPLLDEPLQGAIYLAEQGGNPFGSLLALYVVAEDRLRGVVVKLAGRVDPDPASGQLTVTFKELPQLPFEDLELEFFAGPRAIFTTPPTCGGYQTATLLTPWTAPEGAAATPSDTFYVTAVPGGGACAASEAQAPNAPSFEAGTLAPRAGAPSPFFLRIKRQSGSQRLQAVSVTLPRGLTAQIAGVSECSEVRIAMAEGRRGAGEGALEQAGPSCPASSEVGPVLIGAGSGPPLYLRGHAYLAGPYKGAPFSLAIIVPAVVGPFDLGAVIVRAALRIDPRTARITVAADPFPMILHGIPLDVRSIAIDLSRPGFTRNPTSCDPMAVRGEATSPGGNTALLSRRFQVGDCTALGFKPRVSIGLIGPTRRGAHPRLHAVLTSRPGDAGVGRVALALPDTELLDNRHIGTICTAAEFAAERCPASSIYGHAKAWTPLLGRPLEGPVYLRASDTRLPQLAAALDGQIRLDLTARLDSVGGRLRVSFQALPDAALSKVALTMKGAKRGLFANTGGLCAGIQRADVLLGAQNGKARDIRPAVTSDCGEGGR